MQDRSRPHEHYVEPLLSQLRAPGERVGPLEQTPRSWMVLFSDAHKPVRRFLHSRPPDFNRGFTNNPVSGAPSSGRLTPQHQDESYVHCAGRAIGAHYAIVNSDYNIGTGLDSSREGRCASKHETSAACGRCTEYGSACAKYRCPTRDTVHRLSETNEIVPRYRTRNGLLMDRVLSSGHESAIVRPRERD